MRNARRPQHLLRHRARLAGSSQENFDTFILAGNNLGLLGGLHDGRSFLASLHLLAAPGARVLGEVTDPYRTTDRSHLAYHQENRRLGRLGGQIRLRIRHRLLATEWFDYLFCTPDELMELLAPTQWHLESVHPRVGHTGDSATWVAVLAPR